MLPPNTSETQRVYNAIVVETELADSVVLSWRGRNSTPETLDCNNLPPGTFYNLFNHGITSSSAGDWYLTYQVFRTPAVGTGSARIDEIAAYRAPNGATKQSTIQTGIDPSQWWYYDSVLARCAAPSDDSTQKCYTAGDWFRPTMNTYTVASVPLILGSANLNDLFQVFVQDPPQTASTSQTLPSIIRLVKGTNLVARGVITPAHLRHLALGHYRNVMSSMVYAAASAAGLLTKP